MSDEGIVVVIPGDLHLTEPGLENHRAALRVVEEANRLVRPDFVQFLGDNVQDATEEQFRLFDDLRSRLEVPHFALVGDHDVHDDSEGVVYRRFVGEPTGSTQIRGFRFLRLNTQEARPVGLLLRQVGWFRAQVDSALAAAERIVIFQHNYPYQIWEDFDGPGIDDWREVVQSRRIVAIFTGHTHYGQVANDGRNVVVASRSIGDPEGGAPGYTLAFFDGDDLAITYRSVEDSGPIALITHPRETLLATGPRHIVRGADRVRARTWPAGGVASVRARIDDAPWIDLAPAGDSAWEAPLPGDRLSKGEHSLEARALGRDGREGADRIGFMVDPTGRYTAVPAVRPVVTRTAFC